MKQTRIALVLIMCGLLFSAAMIGCDSGGGGNAPTSPSTLDITGTWKGSCSSSLISQTQDTVTLTQTGSDVTGTYVAVDQAGDSVRGTVSGTVSESSFSFAFNQTTPSCTGTFNGSANISGNAMSVTFTGTDCLGTHSNGQCSLTKQ